MAIMEINFFFLAHEHHFSPQFFSLSFSSFSFICVRWWMNSSYFDSLTRAHVGLLFQTLFAWLICIADAIVHAHATVYLFIL